MMLDFQKRGFRASVRTAGLAGLLACLLPVAGLSQAPPSEAVDAFYLDLFERGRSARSIGDTDAVRLLRLACFGLLEVPDRLAGCLIELALAHAANDDALGFDKTVRRLAEVERLFGSYTAAAVDPTAKVAVIAELASRAPVALLESVPAWKPAAIRRRASDLANLDTAARQVELEKLHALEPAEPRWRRELAATALAAGDTERTLFLLAPLTDPEAACTRGEARARNGDCAGADVEVEACAESATPSLWNARLGCLMATGQWRSAADLHAQFPPQLQATKAYRRMGRDIKRGVRRLPPETAPGDGSEEGPLPAEGGPDATTAPPVIAVTPSDTPVAPPLSAPSTAESPTNSSPTRPQPVSPPIASPVVPANTATGPVDPPAGMPAEAIRAAIERSRRTLLDARTDEAAQALLEEAEALRDRVGDEPEVLLHIAEIHYRLRRWRDAVAAIQASGLDLGDRPTLLFYYAVALFESGDRSAAASAIERAWPRIRQTDFVRSYAFRILGREPG